MADMKGSDVVILGALAWLIWKVYNPSPITVCNPTSIGTGSEPQSSIVGPAWTRSVEE